MMATRILTPRARTAVFLGTLPKGPSTQMVLWEAEYVHMNSFGSRIHLVHVLGPLIGLGLRNATVTPKQTELSMASKESI